MQVAGYALIKFAATKRCWGVGSGRPQAGPELILDRPWILDPNQGLCQCHITTYVLPVTLKGQQQLSIIHQRFGNCPSTGMDLFLKAAAIKCEIAPLSVPSCWKRKSPPQVWSSGKIKVYKCPSGWLFDCSLHILALGSYNWRTHWKVGSKGTGEVQEIWPDFFHLRVSHKEEICWQIAGCFAHHMSVLSNFNIGVNLHKCRH